MDLKVYVFILICAILKMSYPFYSATCTWWLKKVYWLTSFYSTSCSLKTRSAMKSWPLLHLSIIFRQIVKHYFRKDGSSYCNVDRQCVWLKGCVLNRYVDIGAVSPHLDSSTHPFTPRRILQFSKGHWALFHLNRLRCEYRDMAVLAVGCIFSTSQNSFINFHHIVCSEVLKRNIGRKA